MSSPKGLPSSMQLNGMPRRSIIPHKEEIPLTMTPQHEEIIRYIYEQWSRVAQEVDRYSHQNGPEKGFPAPPSYYQASREEGQYLKDFKAVDLDSYAQSRAHQKSDPRLSHPGP